MWSEKVNEGRVFVRPVGMDLLVRPDGLLFLVDQQPWRLASASPAAHVLLTMEYSRLRHGWTTALLQAVEAAYQTGKVELQLSGEGGFIELGVGLNSTLCRLAYAREAVARARNPNCLGPDLSVFSLNDLWLEARIPDEGWAGGVSRLTWLLATTAEPRIRPISPG